MLQNWKAATRVVRLRFGSAGPLSFAQERGKETAHSCAVSLGVGTGVSRLLGWTPGYQLVMLSFQVFGSRSGPAEKTMMSVTSSRG